MKSVVFGSLAGKKRRGNYCRSFWAAVCQGVNLSRLKKESQVTDGGHRGAGESIKRSRREINGTLRVENDTLEEVMHGWRGRLGICFVIRKEKKKDS